MSESAKANASLFSVHSAGFAGKGGYLLLAGAILALDQWTKWLIERHLPEQAQIALVPGFFSLSHVTNTGVAFGLFASEDGRASWGLVAVGLLALAVIAASFWHTARGERRSLAALALVLGGAVGNLLDRVVAGAVTDFLAVFIGSYRWPDFNVADSAISIGLALLIWDGFFPARRTAAAREGSGGEAHS